MLPDDKLLRGHAPLTSAGNALDGAVSGIVKVKADPETPAVAMPGAIVRVHRAADGAPMWGGVSDAHGRYAASGLEPGAAYTPVAIAPDAHYESVAAGPVVAAREVRLLPGEVDAIIGAPLAHAPALRGTTGAVTAITRAGTLPEGVTADGLALVSDWPTGAPGDYPQTYTVIDDAGTHAVQLLLRNTLLPLVLFLNVPPIFKSDVPLAGTAVVATGGEAPYQFAVTEGALPDGVALDSATGALSGTPTATGAFSFTVRCTDTRGGSALLPVALQVFVPDPYFANVVSLLHLDGSLTDVIPGRAWTTYGSGPFWNSATPLMGAASLDVQTEASTVYTPWSSDFALGDGDFTIELMFRPTGSPSSSYPAIVSNRASGGSSNWNILVQASSRMLQVETGIGGLSGATPLVDGQTYHIALCRHGSDLLLWLNGALEASTTASGAMGSGAYNLSIAQLSSDSRGNWAKGAYDEFRLTKGVARYTAPFTPPAIPFPDL